MCWEHDLPSYHGDSAAMVVLRLLQLLQLLTTTTNTSGASTSEFLRLVQVRKQ